jgi:MerR family mercuric resistance operon transcriptional regulator
VYGAEDLKRLYFVCRSRRLGFSLNEIRELLALVDEQDFTCDAIRELTLSQAREVQAKIQDLQKIEHVLRDMAAQCDRGDLPECPVLDTLFAARPSDEISR